MDINETELKKTLKSLREREELLEASGRMAKVGGWELDIAEQKVTWSEETCRIHEEPIDFQPELGKAINYFHPEDQPILREAIKDAIENGTPYDLTLRLITAKGNNRITHSICQPIMEEGKVVRLKGTFQDVTQLKETEEELKRTNQILSNIIEHTSDFILISDQEGKPVLFNDSYRKIMKEALGIDMKPGIRPHKLIKDKQAREWWNNLHKRVLSGEAFTEEFNYPIKGVIHSFEISFHPIIEQGEVLGFTEFTRDITKRKSVEIELKASESKLKSIIESSTNLFYSHTINHELTYVSANVSEILGCEPEEAMRQWTDFLTDNPINEEGFAFTQKAIQTGKRQPTYELELQRKDGRKIRVEVRESPVVENDKVVAIAGSLADITERRKFEEALRNSEKKHETWIRNSPICTKVVDLDFNLQYMSQAGIEELHIQDINEYYGKPYPLSFFPESSKRSMLHALERAREDGDSHTHQGYLSDTLGNKLWYDSRIVPVKDSAGLIEYFLVVSLETTKRKEAEIELRKAKERAEESDLLKSAFLANMSHEIRTPMNGILGFAELLEDPDIEGEDQQRFIAIIRQSGERMLNIINKLIDISKIESGLIEVSIEEVDIRELFKELHTLFLPKAIEKGLSLTYDLQTPSEQVQIKTDKTRLYETFSNLISNAIKYTDKGMVHFSLALQQDQYLCSVEDTGCGISEEFKKRIFGRFVREDHSNLNRPQEGSGLGLSISKAYVELLGGSMWLESELGHGSTFYFTLPILVQPGSKDLLTPAPDEGKKRKIKILVAEDDATSAELIEEYLKDDIYSLLKAENGQKAVELVRINPDVKVVLMDLKMPKLDGNSATRMIKEINPSIKVIAQSAFVREEDQMKALEAGCDDFLAKPIRSHELINAINRATADN